MSTSDTSVPQVIVNKLTQAQYDIATKNPNEFYAIIDADPGASTVIYYANSTSTAGFQSGTINGPYIYKDAARTTIATPGEIYDNFKSGNSIHIEYESTQTGASAFAMTLEVATMSLNGSDTYSMVLNEVNEETPGDSRDLVMLRLHAYWDGQSTFSSHWIQQRKYVNDGTLTIQHNGTTKGTFTANQSTASTVNIETIYADDQIVTTPIDWSNILNHFYPVGSIYMSAMLSTAAAVGDALGGTWVAWGAGRVPVGVDTSDADFDTAEETGGEKTHTLTATEIPSHNHKDLNWATDSYHTSIDSGTGNGVRLSMSGNDIEYIEGKFRTGYTGGGQAHNNIQPYITCYMYKRTA